MNKYEYDRRSRLNTNAKTIFKKKIYDAFYQTFI